ncbi:MAG: hypothetical protein ACLFV0_08500 [Nitriliruptoraceae bacterium]
MTGTDGGGLIEWTGTARRLRRILVALGLLVVVAFGLVSLARGRAELALLAELVGLALLAAFAVEVVVVGGSALRGMLVAGARGERLASQDVGLLPPQILRRARGLPGCGPDGCAVAEHDHGTSEHPGHA